MGHHGREQQQDSLDRLADGRCFDLLLGLVAGQPLQGVDQLHDGGDGGVEVELVFDVGGDLADGLVGLARQLPGRVVGQLSKLGHWSVKELKVSQHQPVHFVQEARRAVHALVAPLQIPLRRRRKQAEEPHGVGAVALDELVGVDHVALGFRHLGAVFNHHALGEQVGEGFVDGQIAQVAQQLGEEAGIEQVQDGMLHTADVLVHRQPVAGGLGRQRGGIEPRAAVAGKVPGGLDKGVHGVGLAARRTIALGAAGLVEARQAMEGRFARLVHLDLGGQHDGQVALRHRLHAAFLAVDHRDRRAPEALPGDAPVAQPVGGLALADGFLLGVADDRLLGCV